MREKTLKRNPRHGELKIKNYIILADQNKFKKKG